MTRDEATKYLESIGGLVNGWYTDKPPITDSYFFAISDHWLELVCDLIKNLIDVGWDKKILQIKEKYGSLRFYISEGSDEIYKLIDKAENDSFTICESCGKVGKLRGNLSWIQVLCEDCSDKVVEEDLSDGAF